MGIAENIKKRRMEMGISQQDLATRMGYTSRSTIAKIEKGENAVPKAKISRFANVLDTTIEFLKTGVEELNGVLTIDKHEDRPHKTVAVILAGGKSTRNRQNIPNQFITVLGKPVIVYCLEAYQRHPAVDDIYVACLKGWNNILEAYAEQYNINKLRGMIDAGSTGILSVKNAISSIASQYEGTDIVILQESTRPLITEEMISKLLHSCTRNGSAVTCEPMNDFVQFELGDDDIEMSQHSKYLNRQRIVTAQSPEAYRLETLMVAFERASKQGHKLEETCMAMLLYNLGYELQFYEGNHNNIKVVRQEDLAILGALLKERIY